MLTNHSTGGTRRALAMAVAVIGSITVTGIADAHFRLVAPANWMMQSSDGSPQKMGPCGNEAPQTPSNMVTPFRPGQVVTIQFMQTVQHPGHYRVALATTSQSQLPAEPKVTPSSSDECASAALSPNTFPVLLDGALEHDITHPLNGMQTIQVTLPTNVTCTNCILQVLEFMSSHGAPCFYHHCANISIQGTPVDGGSTVDAGKDASMGSGGAAGTSGAGGAPGTGGSSATGTGGAPTGGTGGDVVGTTGSGTTTTGAGTTTGNGTTASTTSGTTGSASATTGGSTGSGGSGPSGGGNTDNGCACSFAGSASQSSYGISAVAALAFAIGSRRRRRR